MKFRDAYQLLTHTYPPLPELYNKKGIALTFDDGPDPLYTPQVLALLARFNVKATFFLVGKQVEKYPVLVRQIVKEGHGVGNHTWSHEWPFFQSKSRIRQEIEKTQRIIQTVSGITPTLFRPPFGIRTAKMDDVLISNNLTLILWTRAVKDWRTYKPGLIENQFKKGLKSGAIYLIHDGLRNSKHSLCAQKMKALEHNLEYAIATGYQFASLTHTV